MKIGVVGLGVIGGGLARRLLDRGHEVHVYDLDPVRVGAVTGVGGTAARSAREVAERSEFIVTALPRDEHVLAAFQGPEGIVAGLADGATALECSSVRPDTVLCLLPEVRAKGAHLVDAALCPSLDADVLIPQVTDEINLAGLSTRTGKMFYFVGCAREDIPRAERILGEMSDTFRVIGDVGAGKVGKLLHNAVNAGTVALLSEAVLVAEMAGIPRAEFVEALCQSLANSRILHSHIKAFTAQDHFPIGLFPLSFGEKDLRYSQAVAEGVSAVTPMIDTAHRMYEEACNAGMSDLYTPGIFRYLQQIQTGAASAGVGVNS